MEHTQSYQLGAALGALSVIVTTKEPRALQEPLEHLPETLWDLQGASEFFALLCERTLRRSDIAIDDRVCELTEIIFRLLKELKGSYEMYLTVRGFSAGFIVPANATPPHLRAQW